MSSLPADLRDAIRSLAGRPSFTVMLLLTLALGIGATTTIFSFVYAMLLRPYPYREPDRLVQMQTVNLKEGDTKRGCSLRDIEDYRDRSTRLADLGAYTVFDTRLLTDGPPVVISMAQTNPQALSLLGVAPVLGRLLLPREDRPGGDVYKVVIAHDVWRSQFAGDPDIVGKPLRTDRQTYTIVGVMPPGFAFPERTDAWTPMESWYANLPPENPQLGKRRDSRWYATVARLKPGVSLAEAKADLNSVAAALGREFADTNAGVGVELTPLREFEMGAVRPYLLVCLLGVGMVLLICCANVANLLLVRAATRRNELAVKIALGASGKRIARTLLTESLLLGLVGAGLGILLALAGVRGLLALIPVPLPMWMRVEIDQPVLAFTVAIGLATALLFGLAPALAAARVSVTSGLREGARGSARSRLRSALVVVEVALSVLLLIGAGLMMRTFQYLQQRDPGFRGSGVLAARTVAWADGTRTEAAAAVSAQHQRVLDELESLPGVSSVAVTNSLPYSLTSRGRIRADVYIRGRAEQDGRVQVSITGADVSPGYFETLRIPLVRGRLIERSDTTTSEPVVVISERAAQLFWPNQDPIGRYLSWMEANPENPWTRVVGVVGDVKQEAAEGQEGVEIYYPMTQWRVTNGYYLVRTNGDPDAMAPTVRRTILTAEPTLAVRWTKTVERTMLESLWQRRLWGLLFSGFSVLALALAALGLYGVISYAVAQRRREMGIRMALGASPGGVRGLVLREGLGLCGLGAVLGLGAAFVGGRFVAGLLFGVTPYDAATYGLVLLTIAAVGTLACWLPARHASRVDPSVILRDA
ncbi:MAG: FtsX-like permease family protein [Luteitalea sp.]|nr:FtsX-like permease family protein [Luteitalea sp.]